MSGEKLPGDTPPADIDFEAIHNELALQLSLFPSSAAKEIQAFLLSDPVCPDPEVYATAAKTQLIDFACEHVAIMKSQTSAHIRGEYPAESEGLPGIETPNKYIKRNGLDGTWRPALRQAQAETIAGSKAKIIGDIEADDCHQECDLGVSDKDLLSVAEYLHSQTIDSIQAAAEAVKAIEPERVDHTTMGKVVLSALGAGSAVWRPMYRLTPKQYKELSNAVTKLRSSLNLFTQDPSVVGRLIKEQFEPVVEARLDEALGERYRTLEAEERATLTQKLRAAYDQVVAGGAWYQPKAASEEDSPDDSEEQAPEPSLLIESMDEEKELGKIDSPFPWAPEEPVQVSLYRENGHAVLLCTAMSPIAKGISKLLRGQKSNGEEFADLWQRVKEIESSGNAVTHGFIRITRRVYNEAYKGVSILRYGNSRHNAKRVYYVKVGTEKYPEVHDLAQRHGVDPSTPLLVLIGEVDKAHQLRLYGDFGLSRRTARKGKAGSI